MASGDGFSADQRYDIDRAIRAAETACRYEFSLYVGPAEGASAEFAQRLHASLIAPGRSVLIMIDPAARVLEIVTGSVVRRVLNDDAVRLAAAAMESAFSQGDLVGGIKRGVSQLADAARQPATLHASGHASGHASS
ncbi:DUF5130 family protein [Marmoricola sp. OAE513]|uniref:DUF5130 family protein n=1 Tax=Marmoricola sp. OAE513 TaxID=2817894 RepID=UPI001AE22698